MAFPKVQPFGNAPGEEYRPLPGEYAYPSENKEKFLMKMDMMRDPNYNGAVGNGQVNWSISDSDVNVVKDLEDQRRLYEYHRYIDKHIDPRKPGNLEWLMRIEPDYIKMKMKALNTHMQLMEKKIRLQAFGVQDTDDMRMKFLIDTNQLQDHREATNENRYVRGFFGPRYHVPSQASASNYTDMFRGTSWGPTPGGFAAFGSARDAANLQGPGGDDGFTPYGPAGTAPDGRTAGPTGTLRGGAGQTTAGGFGYVSRPGDGSS
jgi:hypothetical protein